MRQGPLAGRRGPCAMMAAGGRTPQPGSCAARCGSRPGAAAADCQHAARHLAAAPGLSQTSSAGAAGAAGAAGPRPIRPEARGRTFSTQLRAYGAHTTSAQRCGATFPAALGASPNQPVHPAIPRSAPLSCAAHPPPPPRSELATIIKEKKAQLPKPDAEGNRPSSPLDAEIKALEAVSIRAALAPALLERMVAPAPCILACGLPGCTRGLTRSAVLPVLVRGAAWSVGQRACCVWPHLARPLRPLPPQERKELIGQKLNEQHNNWGSLLLGLGVTISIAGAFNTFLRTGGWHLAADPRRPARMAASRCCTALALACLPASLTRALASQR